MNDLEKIRALTDADVPLGLVYDRSFDDFKAQQPTWVSARQLKSSKGILISDGFSRCQGVSFLDKRLEVGAIAHNHPRDDPYYTLTGKWSEYEKRFEDPKKIFEDMNKVVAVHVYHEGRYSWPERCIEKALKRTGIERVVHIPIKSKESGRVFWRCMAQDVKKGEVYIFPTDFNYGLCYKLNQK